MARHKQMDWKLRELNWDKTTDIDTIQTAVLMDIRDLLRELQRIFACGDFLLLPAQLEQIVKNTTPRGKRRAKRRPPANKGKRR